MNNIDLLVKIAEDTTSTYLAKCAAIADAYMDGSLSPEDASAISGELGIDIDDLSSVISVSYGDTLEKEAGQKIDDAFETAKTVLGKARDFYGKDIKKGLSIRGLAKQKEKALKTKLRSLESYGPKGNESVEKAIRSNKSKISEGNKSLAIGAGKVGGTALAGYGAKRGASAMFGKKEEGGE